jgi:hypothetical protein
VGSALGEFNKNLKVERIINKNMFNKKTKKLIDIEHRKEFVNGELVSERYIITKNTDEDYISLSPRQYEELKVMLARIDSCK